MRESAANVDFNDLVKVCRRYFGEPRRSGGGSSHLVFIAAGLRDPRLNVQEKNGQAKPYQVKQVLRAIDEINAAREENR